MGKSYVSISKRAILLACSFLIFFTVRLIAQSDLGSITGYVRDPSGSVVPNAAVTATDESTGVVRTATTNEDGLFSVTNIPSGYYTVTAEAPGFKKYEATHNKLDPNATLRAEVVLEIG